MGSSVRTDEAPDGAREANETTQSHIWPSAAVVEVAKHVRSRSVVGHDPECEEESEKCEDVYKKNDSFGQG